MTELAIFSFQTPAKMSPEAFAALSDADKSLFARLAQECKASTAVIKQATGLPLSHVAQLGQQIHSVRLAGEARVPAARIKAKDRDIPESYIRLLQVFADSDGPLTISYAEMEQRADLGAGSAHPCLSCLKSRGLVVCLRSGRGGRTATWTVTDDGRALALELFSEVAHA